MEANGLMIGDYFYRPDCVDRVVEIHKNGVIGSDPLRGLIPWSEIKPITLTTEILKKNGWVRKMTFGPKWAAVYENKDYPDIWEGIDGNLAVTIYWKYSEVQIESVHKLQHLLRLCGLNDQADNFKI